MPRSSTIDAMMPEPFQVLHLRGVLPAERCADLARQARACADALPRNHADRQPTSGSLRLQALGRDRFQALLAELAAGTVGTLLRQQLGPQVLCLQSQSWIRRQHPPQRRPAGEHPHGWHQDGALGCRFDGTPEQLAALLTLWLPLVDCGDDAPSLQWRLRPQSRVLSPLELAAVGEPDPGDCRHARLAAGDGLLFDGALLHRTHATPAMTRSRVSVEWRFAAAGALPARLAIETTCLLPGAPLHEACPHVGPVPAGAQHA